MPQTFCEKEKLIVIYMSDPFSIVNHIQYKEYMTHFVSKEKCKKLIAKSSTKLEKADADVYALRARNALLESKLRALMQRCAPKKAECSVTSLELHPEYIALKKAEHKGKVSGGQQCPEVLEAQAKLEVLRKQCGKPKCEGDCKPGPIEKHPGYPALMEAHRRQLLEAQSSVEGEMRKKLRSDIRSHPDYSYFKSYYESEIAKLKAQIKPCKECPKQESCPSCPSCPKQENCPDCPTKCSKPNCRKCPKCIKCTSKSKKPLPQAANAGAAESLQINSGQVVTRERQPRPFSYSSVPVLNPNVKMGSGRVHYYDNMKF
jgi:hypothetical protein